MRFFTISALVTVLVPAMAFGQDASPDAGVRSTVVSWGPAAPGSDRLLKDGLVIAVLVRDSIAAAISIVRSDNQMWANVSISNSSQRRLDIDPSTFTLEVAEPNRKHLPYLDPERLARSIRRRAAWGAALTEIAGEMATTETETEAETNVRAQARDNEGYRAQGTARSTTTVTTVTRDEQARARAAADAERITATAATKASDLVNRALRANTLMPGDEIGGVVFFERDRRARLVVLRVPVGELVYEFPYQLK